MAIKFYDLNMTGQQVKQLLDAAGRIDTIERNLNGLTNQLNEWKFVDFVSPELINTESGKCNKYTLKFYKYNDSENPYKECQFDIYNGEQGDDGATITKIEVDSKDPDRQTLIFTVGDSPHSVKLTDALTQVSSTYNPTGLSAANGCAIYDSMYHAIENQETKTMPEMNDKDENFDKKTATMDVINYWFNEPLKMSQIEINNSENSGNFTPIVGRPYIFTGINKLHFQYNYDLDGNNALRLWCQIEVDNTEGATIDITFPEGIEYIGQVPQFKRGQKWEIISEYNYVMAYLIKI